MTSSDRPSSSLHNLAEELVTDVMSLSDAELLAEVKDEGLDPEREADSVRALISAVTANSARARLKAARAQINQSAASVRGQILQLSLTDRAAVLARFANDDAKLKSRLTMAARNGEGVTEQELDDILADLIELGAIDENGNLICED